MSEAKTVTLDPQAEKELAALSLGLAHHPKLGKQFKKMVSQYDPTKRFADIEAEDLRDEVKKEFEKRDRDAEIARVKTRLDNQKNELKSRYDDKAIDEIEKLMEKHGISDYDVGAKLYAVDMKPANPTYEENDHRWKMPGIEIKDFNNLKQISRQRANQAIDEVIRNRKKAS